MNDIIKLLPDSVANQIAAGEVIQRPASVIKELVENAIDAGANDIKIIIKDAGRTLIQVIDNGCGMSTTDARMAFERHATSKITNAADLFTLHTMGFRGEALASIAAIAQVDLRTMRKGESIGTRLIINGSKVESHHAESCATGTNIMVKNLFYNVPARRKFLKKDSVELSNIIHEFERLALVNTNVAFTFIHNENTLYQILHESLKQRIINLFGKSLAPQLIPIETATSIANINGFISLPQNARRRGALQYFFVNGRNMRHPYFHKAVIQCYDQLIPQDEQPNYFINLNVEPETIDVNIHPTKNEIKFENEQAIWQILSATIKESLGKFNAVPSIDFNAEDVPDIPAFKPDATATHDLELDTSYNPFQSYTKNATNKVIPSKVINNDWRGGITKATQNWEKLYEQFETNRTDAMPIHSSKLNNDTLELFKADDELDLNKYNPPINAFLLKDRYIITPTFDSLTIIDSRRAHVRILYEQFISLYKNKEYTTQRLIFPDVVQLTPAQNITLESICDNLTSMGFDISYLGNNSWSINGVPSVVGGTNPIELIMNTLENINPATDIDTEFSHKIAITMAYSTAIKIGQAISQDEIERLLGDLFKLSTPNYTPDGKTIIATILINDISKLFQ